MRYTHFSFLGLLLYSVTVLLLSPFQKEMLTTQTWQLQSIQSKHRLFHNLAPGFISSEKTTLVLQANGQYISDAGCGTWTLRGKILSLHTDQAAFSFRIYQLSKEQLLLKTWVEESCVSLRFAPQP